MIAGPQVSAERFCATGQDVGDGAPMRWQYVRAMRRQVVIRKAAEDVGDLNHG